MSDQREARQAKSELLDQDPVWEAHFRRKSSICWGPFGRSCILPSPSVLLQPPERGDWCSGPRTLCMEIWGQKDAVSPPLREEGEGQARPDPPLASPQVPSFPPSQSTVPTPGKAGELTSWGSWMGFDQSLGSPCWFH